MSHRLPLKTLGLVVGMAACMAVATSPAAASNWNFAGGGAWSDATKWTGGVPNGVDAVANFIGDTPDGTNNDWVITSPSGTIGTMLLQDTAGSANSGWQPQGGSLTLDVSAGSALINFRESMHEVNVPLILMDNLDVIYTRTLADSRANLNSSISTGAGTTNVHVNRYNPFGTGGYGRVVFYGNNSFNGDLTIHAGMLQTGNGNAIPNTADVDVKGGAILRVLHSESADALNGSGLVTGLGGFPNVTFTVGASGGTGSFSGVIQDGGSNVSLTKAGAGTQTLTGATTYTDATTVSDGTLMLAGGYNRISNSSGITVEDGATLTCQGWAQNINALTLNGGTLSGTGDGGNGSWLLNEDVTVAGGASTSTISAVNLGLKKAGGVTFDVGAGAASGIDLDVTGNIWGGGGTNQPLIKAGPGVMRLTGNNTYTAATTVADGTLLLAGDYNRLWSSSGITVEDGATLTCQGWAQNINALTLNGGTLSGTGDGGNGSWLLNEDVTVAGGASTSTISAVNVGLKKPGGVTFDVGAGAASGIDLDVTGNIWGGGGTNQPLIKTGPGVMQFSKANSYTAPTTVAEGTLRLTTNYNLLMNSSSITVENGATLTCQDKAQHIKALTLNGGTLSGTGDGYGSWLLDRDVTVSGGANTSTMSATNMAFGQAGGVVFDVGSGATSGIDLDVTGTFFNSTAGGVANAGFTKAGPGVMRLTGSNAYGGGTTVDDGTLAAGHVNALGSGAVQVNAGGTLDLGAYNVANDITLNGGALYTANGVSGTITLNNVPGNTINANGNYRALSGQVTGDGGFTVGGINTPGIALSNPANDFQGDVTVNGGAFLRLYASEVIPDTATVTVNGNLRLRGGGRTETIAGLSGGGGVWIPLGSSDHTLRVGYNDTSSTFAGRLVPPGQSTTLSLVKIGTGTLTLNGNSLYSSGTTIDGGTLAAGHVNALGTGPATVNSGGTLDLGAYNVANDITLNGGALYIGNGASGTITLNNVAGNAFRASGNYRVISGKITGLGGVTIDGGDSVAGVAFSNPANDFQGNVTVNNSFGDYGRLRLDVSEVIPDAAILTINGGNLRGHDGVPGNKTETIAGLNGDAGAVIFAPNSHGMTLRVGYNDTSSSFAGAIGASWNAGWRDITIVKIGTGTLTLSGNSTYTGGSVVDGGTLRAGHVNALGTGPATVNAGGTLDLGAYKVANDITLNGGTLFLASGASGTITLNNAPSNTINANGYYRIVSGKITGPGGFTFGGINTPGIGLSNPANDFQGDITINPGAYLGVWASEVIPDTASVTVNSNLRLQGDNRTETIDGLSGGGRVFASNTGVGATLRVGAGGATTTFSGRIGLGGANNKNITLVKLGGGTLTLTGNSDYTGATDVDAGTLLLTGTHTGGDDYSVAGGATLGGSGSTQSAVNVAASGILAPGAGGNTAIFSTGALTLADDAILRVGLNGLTPGADYDQVAVTGGVSLDAAVLEVLLGFTPTAGEMFTIIENDATDAVTGEFDGFPEGGEVRASDPGGTEHLFWISYVGGDGANDVVLKVAPEPTTLTLLGLGGLAALLRRRRRRR